MNRSALIGALCLASVTAHAQSTFVILPDGDDLKHPDADKFDTSVDFVHPLLVSEGGKAVAGSRSFWVWNDDEDASSKLHSEAFYWSEDTGLVSCGDLPGGRYASRPFWLAADGSAVLCFSGVGERDARYKMPSDLRTFVGADAITQPFLYRPGQDIEPLERPEKDWMVRTVRFVSDDTKTRLIHERNFVQGGKIHQRVVHIAPDGTETFLEGNPGPQNQMFYWSGPEPKALSADGTTALVHLRDGYKLWSPGAEPKHVLEWRTDEGQYHIKGMSDDASTVIGVFHPSDRSRTVSPFRWTEEGGIELLPLWRKADPRKSPSVTGCNADGTVIVGHAYERKRVVAYVWIEGRGTVPLEDAIKRFPGIDLEDWWLVEVTDVSPDGRAFVGKASNTDDIAGYVITLESPIDE